MPNQLPVVRHHVVDVDGIPVAYRDTDPSRARPGAPSVLLLHGFPSGSHQFRRLIDRLGDEHHLVAPDYPGFGPVGADFPDARRQPWTFDWLADVVAGFVATVGLSDLVLYMFDWGGPIGFRLAQRQPEAIKGLIVQNANMAEAGLSPAAKEFISLQRDDPEAEQAVRDMLTEASTRNQYLTGVRDSATVAPESWLLDQTYLDRGYRMEAQLRLAFDYKTNLDLYGTWQRWLRHAQPPTLVTWGRHDPFFTTDGALAYLDHVPDAEVHLLDTGHFALEDRVNTIATLTADFLTHRAR